MDILGCWAADPDGVTMERTGCDMYSAFEVMKLKPCICWQQSYPYPSSFVVEEIWPQYEKEGQTISNNVKTQPSQQFYFSLHLWCWEGKQSVPIHSWVNYLSLSYKTTDMISEVEKLQNVVIEIHKHGHVRLLDFLLLFLSVFEVLRECVKS